MYGKIYRIEGDESSTEPSGRLWVQACVITVVFCIKAVQLLRWDKVTESWRKLLDQELHYSCPASIASVIKSRRVRSASSITNGGHKLHTELSLTSAWGSGHSCCIEGVSSLTVAGVYRLLL
jgi:hypothetical protein